MEIRQQKPLPLILARELASNVATPMVVVDKTGSLVYWNEAGEKILGQSFGQTGELPAEVWGEMWNPKRVDSGESIAPEDLPHLAELRSHRPSWGSMAIVTPDGAKRVISISAFPLHGGGDEFVGALAIFWEDPS